MKTLLSIDPGVKGCGVAFWYGPNLVRAWYSGGVGTVPHPLLEVVPPLRDFAKDFGPFDTVVCEIPQVYQTAQQKGDQRDLIKLAITVGAVIQALSMPTLLVLPREWKGQQPKAVTKAHVDKRLSEEEKGFIEYPSAASLHHNVIDAIGIGLWRLGRK